MGLMDTDLTASIDAPKQDPSNIARLAVNGIEADSYEILADEQNKTVRAGLAGGVAALYPNPA